MYTYNVQWMVVEAHFCPFGFFWSTIRGEKRAAEYIWCVRLSQRQFTVIFLLENVHLILKLQCPSKFVHSLIKMVATCQNLHFALIYRQINLDCHIVLRSGLSIDMVTDGFNRKHITQQVPTIALESRLAIANHMLVSHPNSCKISYVNGVSPQTCSCLGFKTLFQTWDEYQLYKFGMIPP